MSAPPSAGSGTDGSRTDAERRRRLAAVFGEVLPDTTRDEREPDGEDDRPDGDAWLRAQVPPHHG